MMTVFSSVVVVVALLFSAEVSATTKKDISFGFINGGSAFFEPVKQGFEQQCNDKGVTCYLRRPPNETETYPCEQGRTDVVRELLDLNVDGIAMKPGCTSIFMEELIDECTKSGVPVVLFDSDVANSTRAAYIGTDNKFMGRTMAKLLKQLKPEGGTYALIGRKKPRVEGFEEEISKYNGKKGRANWHEVERNFSLDGMGWMEKLESYAAQKPTAVVTMYQSPMRHPNWTNYVDANRRNNFTYIGVDGADYQLSYLHRRYVDGLVGQLPYEFGTESFRVLYDIANGKKLEKEIFPTNIVAYNLIPLELPTLDVDENLLGNLKYVGLTCFALVGLAAVGCIAWTVYHRSCVVVCASQPFFLVMVAAGVFIMSSSLVPLSIDDGGDPESMATAKSIGICMSIPWLAFTGFTVTFSALFSKTWRVNKVFNASSSLIRVKVSEKDVLAPFAVLLICNFIVLICWTVLDPLTYVREEYEGTDYWNRVISTYGFCRSENTVAFLVPLILINLSVLTIACWQAWKARDIRSEFSESKYIGLTLSSIFQTFLTGIPIVAILRDIPEAFYLVTTFMIFVLCMVILLFIFLPKILKRMSFSQMSETERAQRMRSFIHRSSRSSSFVAGATEESFEFPARNANSTSDVKDARSASDIRSSALSVLNEEDADTNATKSFSSLKDNGVVGNSKDNHSVDSKSNTDEVDSASTATDERGDGRARVVR